MAQWSTSLFEVLRSLAIFATTATSIWLVNFIRLHVLHTSTLGRYLHNGKHGIDSKDNTGSWACVTGASDGIGYCFAEELASRGFNVVLHGRNKDKLQKLRDTLQAQYPSRSFHLLIIDASDRDSWNAPMTDFVSEFEESNARLTVLVNNVGGVAGPFYMFEPMGERPAKSVIAHIDINATFPAVFTHALLPLLSKNQPALILNLCSFASVFPPPYLALYSGSKAFNQAWSEGLAREMEAEGLDIEVMAIMLARVRSAINRGREFDNITVPTSQVFARAALNKVGCGRLVVVPYWAHELLIAAVKVLPGWLTSKMIAAGIPEEIAWERRNENGKK
ncbi:uncharacterized protein A1O9_04181 [Exophiala aquamarina CBS 119918]|uniref:NAD(P)-binding protein n=1 Tax=Exophiala aquamarina CBS 119918 TaxID=1182545 RepID=A0A072PHY1_9EURO|nr:uncharacterized protein A1O9_04181 [Exophiala aquamarina CBS 119918]KEF59337.1 hypothetical protein A1O9_04181 [Exophiala aquamarina CBS 119918]